MRAAGLVAFGWLVPGGAYLLMRRYLQFAGFAALVCGAFVAGLWFQGGYQWPEAADLRGLDSVTSLLFQGGAAAKALAGGPYLLAQFFGGDSHTFLEGRLREYGTTLLVLAGAINLLAVSSALELRKEEKSKCRI